MSMGFDDLYMMEEMFRQAQITDRGLRYSDRSRFTRHIPVRLVDQSEDLLDDDDDDDDDFDDDEDDFDDDDDDQDDDDDDYEYDDDEDIEDDDETV